MAANIEWACCPEHVTECWGWNGRVYRTEKAAKKEQNWRIKYREEWKAEHPGEELPYWWQTIPPVYHIKWEWEVVE